MNVFEKLISFTKKVADLPDQPALNPNELKAQFDAAPDEVRQYLNKLVDALQRIADGDSGADHIGATAIDGLEGTNVQYLLESLNAKTVKKQQEPWITATLQGGAYHVTAGNEGGAAFWKDEMGIVHVRGTINTPTVSPGTVLWNFPTGYRPGRNEYATGYYNTSGNNYTPVLLSIPPDGNMKIFGTGGVAGGVLRIPNFEFRV